ncbi:MAG: kinase/pyrophosphorylase [Nitrospirae bacterium]|nr:kinase/pyrophosphorylase [Nitrospirota bacterium]
MQICHQIGDARGTLPAPKPMSLPKKKVHIFIVSDATGTTAEMVINAVLVQFKDIKPVFKKFPYIRTKEQVKAILNQANAVQGIVIYSLVSQELRLWIRKEKRKMDIFTIDLLGPILDRIRRLWDLIPILEPGLLRGIGEESIRLAESIDFTLKHDDGQGLETLEKANLIILGVSRTSKTPTSLYLSCNYGLKVANVPIILGVKPPDKVFLPKTQKIGFTIAPERLAFIRQRRLKYAASIDYADITHIREELEYSYRIFNQIKGLQILDVTNSSIEEIANRIMEGREEMLGRKS